MRGFKQRKEWVWSAGLGALALIASSVVATLTVSPSPAAAQIGESTSLPLPRFVSLRTEPVNMRTGPGVRYPVTWVYQRRGLPVEVTDEFDTWRRVKDPDGEEGWVHQSMLSGQRTGFVIDQAVPVYKGSTPSSAVIAQLSPGVVVTVDRCPRQTDFCLIEIEGRDGWVRRGVFWGLYEGEIVD